MELLKVVPPHDNFDCTLNYICLRWTADDKHSHTASLAPVSLHSVSNIPSTWFSFVPISSILGSVYVLRQHYSPLLQRYVLIGASINSTSTNSMATKHKSLTYQPVDSSSLHPPSFFHTFLSRLVYNPYSARELPTSASFTPVQSSQS